MRLLFEMDARDYPPNAKRYIRPSVRGIILKGDTIAMVHSLKYNYYKFPGGGIEDGESYLQALIREVAEESGLRVVPDSVREYGLVPRREKGRRGEAFVQDNFYYLCRTQDLPGEQKLDAYEAEDGFTLEYVRPEHAIRVNRREPHGPKNQNMLEREARVLELLIAEHYFSSPQPSAESC